MCGSFIIQSCCVWGRFGHLAEDEKEPWGPLVTWWSAWAAAVLAGLPWARLTILGGLSSLSTLSFAFSQLGCAGTSYDTKMSSCFQGCAERGRIKTPNKQLCLLAFHCVPSSKMKARLSSLFFQGPDVSKIWCLKTWRKPSALCDMTTLERKRPQAEVRAALRWTGLWWWECPAISGIFNISPQLQRPGEWLTLGFSTQLTAYASLARLLQYQNLFASKYMGDFGVHLYLCLVGSMCSLVCQYFSL